MTGRIPSRGSDQFNLRLPDGMRERIAEAAASNGRSMNAEIVSRLEATFAFSGNLAGPDINDRVEVMIRATAAGATLDAIAAAQAVWDQGGKDLTSEDLYSRISSKLGELTELKVSALRAAKGFRAIPATKVESR